MKICLKELRETYNCIRLINRRSWIKNGVIKKVEEESYELISIFVKSIITAKQNQINTAHSSTQIKSG
jgi:hypothetical protein